MIIPCSLYRRSIRNIMNNQEFFTDSPIHPGEHLKDTLDELGLTQVELAARIGLARKVVNEIIQGKAPISTSTAIGLERILKVPAHIWINLQRQYDLNVAWLEERKQAENEISLLSHFPIKKMQDYGWIEKGASRAQLVTILRDFLNVSSLNNISDTLAVQFRQTPRGNISHESIYCWIRRGENVAKAIETKLFDKKQLINSLASLRDLTRTGPDVFQDRMRQICAGSGVAVALVPELPNTHINGATFWLENRTKAVVLLSLRFKTNDHFWFSFFHELGHILLHNNKSKFIDFTTQEENSTNQQQEEQANRFAADLLISPDLWQQFCQNGQFTKRRVFQFSESIHIAPGIVVGRLQWEGLVPYRNLNDLKERYYWK